MSLAPAPTAATRPSRDITAPAEAFREVMAGVASPGSVITTLLEGVPHGTTVSLFASLSMDPTGTVLTADRSGGPLTYHARVFGTHAALESAR